MKPNIKNISKLALLFLLAFIALGIVLPPRAPLSEAERLKTAIAAQLQEYINSDSTAPLALHQIGGVEWDLICVSGYYESGLETVKRILRPEHVDFSKFSVADEYFLDAETGLVFISEKKKILLTVPFKPNGVSHVLPKKSAESEQTSLLMRAENAYLIKDGILYNKRYLKLTDKPPEP